uniref:DUF3168 domain-containing protein n=1 Tax=viral metagenome TaxID=1070528 RepID=A0A6M3L9Y2_9ZZZZ
MSSIGEDIKAYLLADITGVNAIVSGRVHQNHVPIIASMPHIWYGRSADEEVTCMDGGTGLHRCNFDVECIASSADAAIDLADAVKSRLHTSSSTTGGVNILVMFVNDHDDNYVPKGLGSDDGSHVSALDVRILYT